jgi:hypothetical protein
VSLRAFFYSYLKEKPRQFEQRKICATTRIPSKGVCDASNQRACGRRKDAGKRKGRLRIREAIRSTRVATASRSSRREKHGANAHSGGVQRDSYTEGSRNLQEPRNLR